MPSVDVRSLWLAFGGVSMSMLLSTSSTAQDNYEMAVILQLRERAQQMSLLDAAMTHDPFIDKMDRGRSDRMSLTLREDRTYTILGVCDQDCLDMDIRLFDENNQLIDEDLSTDDAPLVRVTPAWTGKFWMEVSIPRCYAWRCTYGVAVFGD